MSDNRVLRNILQLKIRELTGDCRKLGNGQLHDFYSSTNIFLVINSRGMKWAGHTALTGETRGAYILFVAKPERKRALVKPTCRDEDNIIMDLKEISWEGMEWKALAQDRDK
jgi:hypothetical protein